MGLLKFSEFCKTLGLEGSFHHIQEREREGMKWKEKEDKKSGEISSHTTLLSGQDLGSDHGYESGIKKNSRNLGPRRASRYDQVAATYRRK